jgi:molybdate transport system substrate-binding protein
MKLNFPVVAVGSLVVLAGLFALLYQPEQRQGRVILFCAAGLKPPVSAALADYAREFPDVEVNVIYSGSGTLLGANIKLGQPGDLFLAADASYVDAAHAEGLVNERLPVASMTPVLAVKKGNESKITSLRSLLDEKLKFGLGNPDGPAIGRASKEILEKAGLWRQIEAALPKRGVYKPTVHELAGDLTLGTIDVAILFDATVIQFNELTAISIPDELNRPQDVTLGVLTRSAQSHLALHVARFLTAKDRGLPHFESAGYRVHPGDAWADKPKLVLYSGGVLRPALKETIEDFSKREGVEVQVVYNGCGLLVSGIQAAKVEDRPDAYFACDTSFLTPVADFFLDPVNLSRTKLAIAVQKGNPKHVKSLADLAREGVVVGIGHPEHAAFGRLTADLLKQTGDHEAVMKNATDIAATADMLITKLQAKALDAAIVYEVNARRAPADIDVVPIPEATKTATQPFVISRATPHKQLAERLLSFLRQNHARFTASGFEWIGGSSKAATAPPQ